MISNQIKAQFMGCFMEPWDDLAETGPSPSIWSWVSHPGDLHLGLHAIADPVAHRGRNLQAARWRSECGADRWCPIAKLTHITWYTWLTFVCMGNITNKLR